MGRNDPDKDLGICMILGSPQRHNSEKDGENERKTDRNILGSSRIGRSMTATQKSAQPDCPSGSRTEQTFRFTLSPDTYYSCPFSGSVEGEGTKAPKPRVCEKAESISVA